ncbi:MAG: UDP-3-O-acyl-N-acetylglucosamine deacetylase [Desulfobacterales bacterium]|nr:UDP-3-O-acyl-N-acetylglucosamine deacetylase [Desulfobacterales bacterium]
MKVHSHQRTLAKSIGCSGIGVHSGKKVNLVIHPAPINHGIKFIRTDLPDSPSMSAHFNRVVDTSLATVIGHDGYIVSTIEHLMACFAGLSIDNALVELDAYEVPIMDGSAGPFTSLIKKAGIKEQISPRYFFVLKEPIELKEGDKFVGAYPSESFKITYTIEFDHPLVKKQSYSVELTEEIFEREISRARTFGFLHEIEYLKKYGFARGGSLENAVVIDQYDIINKGGLRYKNEFVRHKILDSIGDFSLLGMPILGHIVLNKSGHAFNHAFLKKFFSQKESWETHTIYDIEDISHFPSKLLAI